MMLQLLLPLIWDFRWVIAGTEIAGEVSSIILMDGTFANNVKTS